MVKPSFVYSPSGKNWLYDEYAEGVGLSFKVKQILFNEQTKFQDIKIVKAERLGKTLLLNNWIYRTENEGRIMPEMIVHVSMNTGSSSKRRILLIGGGDGYSTDELAKYEEIESIDMVDIDEAVVKSCSKHFPIAKVAFSDRRVNIHVAEGSEFLSKQKDNFYDLILVTGTEAYEGNGKPGISYPLFQKTFYKMCLQKLKKDGILLTDGQNGYYGGQFYKNIVKKLKLYFPIVKSYTVTCKYIPGGLYVITIASRRFDPEEDIKSRRVKTRYYNAKIHRSAFALPTFLI